MKPKYILLLTFIVNIILRIPRMLYAQGLDGIYVVWESSLILNGDYFRNGFNLISSLGLYEFSGYPIGTLLVMSFFLLITGRHVMISILMYDLFFTAIFVVSTYLLAKELELKNYSNLFFILLSTTIPNLLFFSYYTSSARFPFYAMVAFVYIFLIKWIKQKKIKFFFFALLIALALNFFHRTAFVIFIIFIMSIIIYLANYFSKKEFIQFLHNPVTQANTQIETDLSESIENPDSKNKMKNNLLKTWDFVKQRLWIFSLLGLTIISLVLFGVLNISGSWISSDFNIYCYLSSSEFLYNLIQPFVDLWFHFGLGIVLLFMVVILLFINRNRDLLNEYNQNSNVLTLIVMLLPFVIIFRIIYSTYYIFTLIALISAIGMNFLQEKKPQYNMIFSIVLSFAYMVYTYVFHFIAGYLLPYVIISTFWFVFSFIPLVIKMVKKINSSKLKIIILYKKYDKQIVAGFITTTVLLTSLAIVDRMTIFYNQKGYMYPYITQEQKEIADYLKSLGRGTFDSFDLTMSTQIAALCEWYFIQDMHSCSVFLLDDVRVDEINCSITSILSWLTGDLVSCNFMKGVDWYHYLIIEECLSLNAIYILQKFDIKYFITEKDSNIVQLWDYNIPSPFIESLSYYAPLVKTTEHFNIWNLTSLYQ